MSLVQIQSCFSTFDLHALLHFVFKFLCSLQSFIHKDFLSLQKNNEKLSAGFCIHLVYSVPQLSVHCLLFARSARQTSTHGGNKHWILHSLTSAWQPPSHRERFLAGNIKWILSHIFKHSLKESELSQLVMHWCVASLVEVLRSVVTASNIATNVVFILMPGIENNNHIIINFTVYTIAYITKLSQNGILEPLTRFLLYHP